MHSCTSCDAGMRTPRTWSDWTSLKSLDREHPRSDVSCHFPGTNRRFPTGGRLPLPRTRRWRARLTRSAKAQLQQTGLEPADADAETPLVVLHSASRWIRGVHLDRSCAKELFRGRSHPFHAEVSTVRINEVDGPFAATALSAQAKWQAQPIPRGTLRPTMCNPHFLFSKTSTRTLHSCQPGGLPPCWPPDASRHRIASASP